MRTVCRHIKQAELRQYPELSDNVDENDGCDKNSDSDCGSMGPTYRLVTMGEYQVMYHGQMTVREIELCG